MNKKKHAASGAPLEERLSQALKEKEVFAKALVEFNQSFDKKVRELSILRRISDVLLSSFNLESILCHTLDVICEEIVLVNSSIMLLENGGEGLVLKAARGVDDSKSTFYYEPYGVRRIPVGTGVAGTAVKTQAAVLCQDTSNDKRFVSLPGAVPIGSLLCLPLMSKGRVLGVMNLSDSKPLTFTPEDERVLVIVAGQLAIAIENARLIDRLLENERLSTLGKMAATIIHDMKNPLQVISGYAELLASGSLTREERLNFFDIIEKQVERFTALAQETLEFSRGAESRLERQIVKLRDFAADLEVSLKPEFERLGIRINTIVPEKGVMNIDNEKMLRVMFNLANNARDAMPGGGELTITYSRDGGGSKITMDDTGEGIPEKILDRLFEPFVTYGKTNGTGLGLAIVKKIVNAHKGDISVENSPQGGARFIIEIPD